MDASTSRGKNKIIWSTKEGLAAFGWPSEAMFQRELWIIPLSRYWALSRALDNAHTGHQFLEVHTQVLGTGHMQKFRENNPDTLYESVAMCPGFTHDPFFVVGDDRSF